MKKRFKLLLVTLVLCFIMGLNVQAAQNDETEVLAIEEQSKTDLSITPRATLHLSTSKWNSSNTVKVAINYSVNDATNKIVGVQRGYIAEYNPNFVKKPSVVSYGVQSNGRTLYAKIAWYDLGGNYHYQELYWAP